MDESALERQLNSLENSWSLLDAWLKLCITLVVIGVITELFVVFEEYWHERKEYWRASILSPRPPSRPRGWKYFFEFLGAGLVAMGVSGELLVHFKAARVETDMRDATKKLVALVRGRAAKAELEAARLYLLTAPRRLTEKQQGEVAARLEPFKNRKLIIVSHAYDPEGYMFAKQLVGAMPRGLVPEERIVGAGGVSGMGTFNTETGVVVAWSSDQKDFGETVIKTLHDVAQLKELTRNSIQGGTGEVWITVNWKPFPP